MKTQLGSALRLTALIATCAIATASAKDVTHADRAAQLLSREGNIPIAAAGPYVEVGTYAIQVATKLGAPTAKLPDGTWLYGEFDVESSNARGTLVVRFTQGRVRSLSLVTPTVATAMMNPKPAPAKMLANAGR